jgi:hypothetical protein
VWRDEDPTSVGFVRKWRALSGWKKRWGLSWAELVRMRLTFSCRKKREKSYCVGPVKRKIVASSHKTRREIGILLFWASRTSSGYDSREIRRDGKT